MNSIALKMLVGDRAKYLGLIFGIAFATLLIAQQTSIFAGLMARTASVVRDVAEADIWVMDPRVEYIDQVEALRDADLYRVRAVPGVAWAVPFLKGSGVAKSPDRPRVQQVTVLGIDEASLVGAPRRILEGRLENLYEPDAAFIDVAGHEMIYGSVPFVSGRLLEVNDRRVRLVGMTDARTPFQSQPILYVRYATALELLPPQRSMMSFVLAKSEEGAETAAVLGRIGEQTGLQAVSAEDFAWRSIDYTIRNTGIPIAFGSTIGLGIIVGCAVAGLTFNLFITENLRQFGALKAIGVGNRQIVGMVAVQALLILFAGYGTGIGLAAAFFEYAKHVTTLRDFTLHWQIMAMIAVLMAAVCAVAVAASLRKVLVLDPAVVFRG